MLCFSAVMKRMQISQRRGLDIHDSNSVLEVVSNYHTFLNIFKRAADMIRASVRGVGLVRDRCE